MRKFMSILATVFLAAFVSSVQAAEEANKEPAFLRVGVGAYDVNDNKKAGEFHIEYISDSKWWVFTPFAGFMGTTDTALYAYGGIRLDLFLGDRFVFTPSFAPGLYDDGDGKDLGHVVQFRSALELAYRFDNRARLGISAYHLSNASLDENNPGTEVINIHYSYPFNRLFD